MFPRKGCVVALLEESNVCSICGNPVHGVVYGIPVYYCAKCFKDYNTAILMRELWLKVLMTKSASGESGATAT